MISRVEPHPITGWEVVPACSLTEAVGLFQTRTLKRKMMKNVDDEVKGKMEGTRLEYIYISDRKCGDDERTIYVKKKKNSRIDVVGDEIIIIIIILG